MQDPLGMHSLIAPQQTTISPTALLPGLEAMPTDWSFPELPTNFDLDSFLNFPWHGDANAEAGHDTQWMI
jgi:hypothetical protein